MSQDVYEWVKKNKPAHEFLQYCAARHCWRFRFKKAPNSDVLWPTWFRKKYNEDLNQYITRIKEEFMDDYADQKRREYRRSQGAYAKSMGAIRSVVQAHG